MTANEPTTEEAMSGEKDRYEHNGDGSKLLAEPPFYRGEMSEGGFGGWEATVCDYIAVGADTACDAPSEYLIEWQRQAYDCDSTPISGACERHALEVDRRQVVRMSTHPYLAAIS